MGQPLACLVALCLALASAGGSEPQGEGRARNHGHNVCSTWGDFHYKTFDGDVFRFPGLCDYNLASDCRDAYKEFAVHLKRGPGLDGGHPQVEYILLTIKDDTIYLTHQLVVVNGAMVSTPHYRSGLLIEKSDAYTKVFSRAGLTLMWNREDALMLELDSRFRNHTCGLCGDYNGLQTYSEFLSDGVTFSAIEFGNMQKINKPETVCDDPEEVSAPKSCSEHRAECERLLKAAAFTECLGLVPLEPYVQTCAQDRCQCPPGASCVCSTLAEFSRQCSHAGGRPGNWRTASLCPKTCPGNMVYLESGSPCMDTCSHLEVSHLCEEHRMDGCFCPEGTVYDDIKGSGCVPVSQCHCQLHGHLYAPGQQVRHDCEQCVCNAGRWTCQDLPCPGTCALEGGSHITTFDGKKYTFHGDCYYVLAKGDHGDSYALLGELGPCGATDKQTCLKTVVLLADKEKNVVVFKSEGSVLLNELQVNLPHVTASFSIFQPSSYHLVVSTSFGLRLQIQLEPVMQLFLTLDQEAQGRVQGLCGNFNGQEGDDFKTAGGLVEATGASFANTWKAQSSCQDKLDWLDDPCYLNIESANYAEHWCSLLKNRETPFGRCHSAVDPAEYYKRCKYDTCNCQNNEDCMCAALSSYARACAARGVMLWGWRDLVCNKDVGSCPRSQVFLYNLTTCQQTCRSLSEADSHCLQGFTPVDGCGCPDHTFLDEKGRCVPLAKCSCYHRGLYVEAGDVVLRQEERCVCRNGRLHCNQVKLLSQSCRAPKIHIDCNNLTALAIRNPRPLSCQTLAAGQYQTECVSGCVCPEGLLDDGRGGCVREHECPCVHNQDLYAPGDKITVDCNSCTCQSGRWACSQRVCHGTCTIYGSGHYITFDGKHYDFDGHCTYVAAQDYCGQNSSLGSFSIVTENVPCGTTGVTCSKAIKIFMGRTELKLEDKHRSVIQRDVGHHVAYTTREVGLYLVVETSTGIIVIWDKKTTIFIKLAPSYKGTVCGLCGNFDQRSSNDFTTRGHMVVDSELEFGNSWKEAPTCPDVTTTIEPCNLKPHRRAWAEKQCSIIKDEVFRVCHSKVDPKPFYDACVHDSCSCDSGGDCECFCSAVAAYAQQCTKEGACVFWRTPNLCPIFCDYYNPPDKCEWHYEPCGNRSFETCRTVHGIHSNISVSYLEGCYPRCPVDRPIYDEDLKQCVTRDQCGCFVEDTHYPPGVSVPPKHDCESCVCTNDSKVNCWPEEGKILNYTQNGAFCYWEYCGPNGTVEQHFNICVSTPTPISTPITTTPVTTTTTTTTTPTPTPSTVSSPPSTTPKLCCFWSDWINNDHPSPSPDGGDRETFDSVCQAPEDIECRSATEPHLCWEELGQKVQCDVSSGFTCRNEDQFGSGPFPICYDYEIRVNCCLPMDVCPESTTSTPTPTATPTTSPTTTPTTTSPTTTPTTTTSPTTTPTTTTTTTEIPTTTPTTTSPTTTPTTTTTETPTPTPTTTTTEIPTTTPTTTSPTTTPTTTTTTTETPTTSPITPTPEPTTTVTTTTTTTTTETPTPPPTTITTTTETPTPTPTTTTTETPTPTPTTTSPTTTPTTTTTSPTTTPTTTTTSPTTTPTTTTSPTTPTTVTTRPPTPGSTPCEYCSWTGWNSTGKPNATSTGGDIESIKNFCHSGWAANISCRAAMFPDRPIEDLGQKVVCDLSVGLVCKNQDQKPGGPTFMPICLNYEINVYCCSYDCVTTTPVTPSTTPTISSTGTPTTTPHSTTPVPPTTTPTTTTTTTPEPTTTVTTTPTTTTTTTETPTPTPTTTITETPTPTPTTTITETPTPTPTTTSPITPTPEPTTTVTTTTPTTTSPTTTPTTTTTTTETPTTSPITPTPEPTTTVTTTTTTETPTPPPTTTTTTTETPTTTPTTTSPTTTPTTTTTTTETPTTTPTTTSPTTTPTTTTTETPTTTPTTTSPTTTPTTTTTTTETPTTSPITPTPEPTTTVTTTTTTTTTETPTPPPTTITTETPTPTPTTTTTETPTTTPTTTSPTTTPTTTTTTTTETPTTSPITPTPEPTTTVTTTTTTTTTETPTPPPTTITITTETPTTSPITPTPEPTTTVMTTTTTTTTETPTPPPTTITTTTETPTPTPTTTTTETPTPTPTTTTTETPTTTPTTTSPTTTPTTTTTSPTTTPTTTTSPTTPTTVTTRPPTPGSTPCEYCSWTGWNSTGKPNATSTGGDIESIKNFCHSGWAANISCRAAMFPDRPIEDLGQKVVCDLSVGLVCKNQDQKPGGPTFMPICLNYEINVYCCSYDCVTTTPVTPSTTPTISSTGTPTTTPHSTTPVPPTPTPTISSTGTPTTTPVPPTTTPTTTSTGTPTTPVPPTTTTTTTSTGTPTTTPVLPTTTPTTTPTGTPTTTSTTTSTGTSTTTPTTTPTGTPTTTPTTTSTGTPTTTPTTTPTGTPTTTPTTTSTGTPTTTPTTTPTGTPTTKPTTTSTGTPTTTPTTTSTGTPTTTPTTTPTGTPTTTPTTTPTETPTTTPTTTSTGTPTTTPTTTPTGTPTTTPTTTPTGTPTTTPTTTSTTTSTGTPTTTPTTTPTGTPTTTPTTTSTGTPTTTPTTTPTGTPTTTPTTTPTGTPTTTPTTTSTTTSTGTPTTTPTTTPTGTPTTTPTTTSTGTPTTTPTTTPTGTPTTTPTTTPTGTPTTTPTTTSTTTSTGTPTTTPTTTPTGTPTTTPTTTPTGTPTTTPTTTPTGTPTTTPTTTSTGTPTTTPTTTPTGTPTTTPTTTSTGTPTTTPTTTPTGTPTTTPTTTSTGTPTTTSTTTSTGTPTTPVPPPTTPTTTSTGTPTTTSTTTSTGTPTTTPTTTPTGTPTTTSTTTPVPPTTTPTTTPTGTPTTTPVPPTTTSTTTSTGTPTTTPVPPTTTPTTTSTGTPTTPHSTTPVPPTTTPTTTSTGTPTTPHSTTPVPPTTTPTTTSTGTPTTTPVSQSTSPSSTESTTPQTTSPTAVKTTETKPTVTTPGNTPPGTQTSGPTSSKTTPTSGTTTGPPSPSTEPPSTPTPTPGTVSTTTTGTPTPPGHPSTTTATSVPVPSLSTPSSTPPFVAECCEVNGTYYQPGDVVYNGTHGNTCYFVNCSLSCTLEIFNWSCPATPSTPSTPTPTTPLSEPTTSTRSPTTPTTLSSTPTVSKPPGCPLDPPRQENETWWLCNCTMAICKHDNTVELVQVECKPPPMPTCSNNLKPVRVMDPDGCCWHWECDCYCTGWGDPHYVTFDGLYYSYQGNCTYVLVEEINPTVDNFGVYIDNYHCDVNDQVSCPRTLIVRHETQEVLIKTVHMAPMKVQVQINKQAVALPYRKYGLQVYESGINFVVDIPELGALISYNGLSFSIRLPYKQFGNNTKGQCGTCTNSTADDCVLPSGEVVSDCEVAADQWVVNDPSKPHCPHTSFTTRRPAITAPGGGPAPSKNCSSPLCELIKDSLFAQCHPLAPPEHYYQACVFDTCTVPNLGLECSSLQTYAALCAHEGICIDWRNHTHGACPMTCPPHKEYQACGPAEEPTCKSGSSQNSSLLVEGCFCPEGTMSYAPGFDVCVDVCGCVGPDNVPREFGEHFEFDCKDCVCLEGGSGIVCQPKKCSQEPPAKCEEDGTYLVTEVNPADTCCNITTCKCNASMCQGKPPQCPLGFDVKSEMKPGRCCPFYSCVPKGVCVVLNAEYQPGSPVFSSKCETCVCTNTTDPNTQLNQVSCSHVPCKETCDPGFGLVTVPGECCKKCEQTHCIINRPGGQNLILKPGDMKSDPTNNCTFFSCVKIHNQLISSVSNITCPDFDPSDCLPGSITFMPNGCCKKCILRNETKIPCSTVSETKEISDGSCTAHVTMNYCSGSCGTFAMYSAEAQALDHKCSCCKEERTSQREALLRCPDGSWRSHTYTHIESCQCQDTLCELPAQRQGPRRARRSGHPSLHLPGRD